MTVSSQLTVDLRKLVLRLEDDLRERLAQDDENLSRWKAEHQRALDAQRTASAWQAWRDDKITQAAVAWILTTVFVRFAEDNALVRPVWISGPRVRRQEALDAQIVFFRGHPELTDREWLLEPVEYLKGLPATADLVGEYSALWQVQPSGRMATDILEFWRQTDSTGQPSYNLADPELSTRFLGDLYQDLSDYAKKTFALLQTPEFVEEFILDQTLTPALAERPLEGFKLIDPTCGSGHFLLGAFARLTEVWAAQSPGMDARARVQKALDSVNGVDLNPFAVAIARFRLTVAALKACNETSLELAPAFNFHLAAGDSLLHGQVQREFQFEGFDADAQLSRFAYAAEDLDQLKSILRPGQYDVVVGNPPYITVKDKTLNAAYRKRYETCSGLYALTVPFMERFFGLAKRGSAIQPAGWTGQITSNSFMKRGFGAKLIEEYLSRQDLRLVVDTSGAFIPGHGTPTVILVGRHQRPVGSTIRAVLSLRGEPGRPSDPARAKVWGSIAENADTLGWADDWINVQDIDRARLATHPWSLSGGGAIELLTTLDANPGRLSALGVTVGRTTHTGLDDFFYLPRHTIRRIGALDDAVPVFFGEHVRDFVCDSSYMVLFPYDQGSGRPKTPGAAFQKLAWNYRTILSVRVDFQKTLAERGLRWFDHSMFFPERYKAWPALTFANVATHNHVALAEESTCFTAHSPLIFVPGGSQEDHLSILGLLNSSTFCFWLKQNSHNKGEGGGARVDAGYAARGEAFRESYEFTGTTLKEFPMPGAFPVYYGRELNDLANRQFSNAPSSHVKRMVPTQENLSAAHIEYSAARGGLRTLQEELDWDVYRKYGLISEDLTYHGSDLPNLNHGERAFEIVLARNVRSGGEETTWFTHPMQMAQPVTQIPSHWPESYRQLVQRRLDTIASNSSIRLLERPEYKRRWATEPWGQQQERALRVWLLDRLEDSNLWFDRQGRPTARSVSQLADTVSRDDDFRSVLSLWSRSRDVDLVRAITDLLIDDIVPYLPALRLKDSGLRKYEAWEKTWDLQRREDAGENVGTIPVPPKYTSADFRKASWWQARGKLDMPNERFVVYPDAGRSTDKTLLIGWAGWNHVEQFLALAGVMDQLVADGAPDGQLIPLVAGMGEILPWVEQWHADIDPAYGVSMADFCAQQFEERAAQIDRSQDQLKAWRPTSPTRGRRTKVTQ